MDTTATTTTGRISKVFPAGWGIIETAAGYQFFFNASSLRPLGTRFEALVAGDVVTFTPTEHRRGLRATAVHLTTAVA